MDSECKTYKTQREQSRGSGCSASAILCTLRIAFFLPTNAEIFAVLPSCRLTGDGMKRTWWIRDGNGGRINKTLRFCRRCIDVVFILSSLMSTCELDRFVIQTPYIKVLKSCSVPFVDRAGIDGDSDIDGHGWTDGTNERRWINAYSLFRVCALRVSVPLVNHVEKGPYPCANSSPFACFGRYIFLKSFPAVRIFLCFSIFFSQKNMGYHKEKTN